MSSIDRVEYALLKVYNPNGAIMKDFTNIKQAQEALQEQVNSLEDIDDVAGSYRNLAERAIDELQAVEEEAAISYDKAGELRKELEEMKNG